MSLKVKQSQLLIRGKPKQNRQEEKIFFPLKGKEMGCCLEIFSPKKAEPKQKNPLPEYFHPPHDDIPKNEIIPVKSLSRQQSLVDALSKEESIALKEKGNQSYKKNDFLQAIRLYTSAINLFKESVYFSNRALCYRQLSNWSEVLKDACEAIRLDQDNFKAYNLKGMAQVMLSRDLDIGQDEWESLNSQGIKSMQKALDMINADSKKHDFQLISQIQTNISKSIQILNLKKQERKKIKVNKTKNLIEKLSQNTPIQSQEIKKFLERKLCSQDQKPYDAFVCIFTLDLMVNPVLTCSGMSYEKSLLSDHVKANGEIDPTTRVKINSNQYIENTNLRLAIQDYQRKVIDYGQENNYSQINF